MFLIIILDNVHRYPTKNDFVTVCSTLVMTHPCLEDKVRSGQNSARYVSVYDMLSSFSSGTFDNGQGILLFH